MKTIRLWTSAALLVLMVSATCLEVRRREVRGRIAEGVRRLAALNWICYAPTQYDPRRKLYPTRLTIQQDLETIRAAGFDGVITYEYAGALENIPDQAKHLGLKVIQGVWGPADRAELERAARLKDNVEAYCVGNEGLGSRYTIRELDQGLTYLSNSTGLPTAISEQIHLYFAYPALIDIGDWLFPIVHPHFGNAKSFDRAVAWLDANTSRLVENAASRGQHKILFLKEVGMPSGGDNAYSEPGQARFLEFLLQRPGRPFALFEAFDRKGWEYITPVEPYWGLFHSDRAPKQAALRLRQILMTRRPGETAVEAPRGAGK
jgi:exo-beta-1,3-glucanase (GH17 family)